MHWIRKDHVRRQKLLPGSGEGKESGERKGSSLLSVLLEGWKISARSQTETEGRSNTLLSSEWRLGDGSFPSMGPLQRHRVD